MADASGSATGHLRVPGPREIEEKHEDHDDGTEDDDQDDRANENHDHRKMNQHHDAGKEKKDQPLTLAVLVFGVRPRCRDFAVSCSLRYEMALAIAISIATASFSPSQLPEPWMLCGRCQTIRLFDWPLQAYESRQKSVSNNGES